MAENNNSNPPNDQHADDQHDGAENAQQALDDLTVLQNVQNQNMGDARLNVARSVDVSDTQLGNLANVQQGSTGSPQVQNLGGIAGGVNIAIDVEIESSKDSTVAPPELESLAVEVQEEARTVVVNPGGAKPLNVRELPDLAKPDAEFKDQDPALGQPVTLTPPGGFVANALAQDAVAEAPAAEEEAPEEEAVEIQAAVNQAPTVAPQNLVTANDDDAVSGNVGAVDPDGDALTYSLVGADADGRFYTDYGYVTIDATGQYTFTPDARADAIAAGDDVQLSFTVNVSDGTNITSVPVGIDLNGSNDEATISGSVADLAGTVTEDGGLTASGTLSVADDDAGEARVQAFSQATDEGTFTINENGQWTFELNNANSAVQALGVDSDPLTKTFTVTSADGTATQEVTVTIKGTNDGPTVSAGDDVVIDEDSTFSGTAVGGDIDVGDRLTYALVDEGGNRVTSLETDYGTVTIDAGTGKYTFTPGEAAGALGVGETAPDSFKVVSIDSQGAVSQVDSVEVTITGSNDGPFVSDTVTLTGGVEDNSFTITREQLLSKAYDVDGGDLEISNLSATNGTITENTDGTYTFTPSADFNGNVDLTYTISDGQGGVVEGTATLDVAAVNDGPVVSGAIDLGDTAEDNAITFTAEQLLGKASDIDGDTLSVSNLSASNGVISQNADGSYTFTPNDDFNGDVNITYTVSDGHGGTTTGTATLDVTAVDDDSVITGDTTGSVTEDGTLVASGDLDATDADQSGGNNGWGNGDQDAPGGSGGHNNAENNGGGRGNGGGNGGGGQGDDDQAAFVASSQSDEHGTFTINAEGNWSYTLNNASDAVQSLGGDDHLTKTFTVQTEDGTTKNVTITVNGANDGPTTGEVTLADATEDRSVTINASDLLANASDVDGDTLSVSNVSATNGTLVDNGDGTYTFTPNADYNGGVDLTYTISDGNGATTQGSASFEVNAVNDAPEIVRASDVATDEDHAGSGRVAGTDVDAGDTVTYHLVDANGNQVDSLTTEHGSVTINPATGEYTFTPNEAAQALGAGATQSDSFQVVASDGSLSSAPTTVDVTIGGVNDQASISGQVSGNVGEDGTLSVTGTLAVSDVDAGEAKVQATSIQTDEGTFSIGADGNWTFDLNNGNADVQALGVGDSLTKTFTVTSADGTATQDVTVTITGSNDGPVVSGEVELASGTEDRSVTINASDLLANASDIDGDTLSVSNLSATNGTIVDNGDGTYTFTPNADYNGGVELSYTVSDGHGGTTQGSASFEVNAVNDAPEIVRASDVATDEDHAGSGRVAGTDVDAGDTVTYHLVDANGNQVDSLTTEHGSVTINPATGEYTFTPNEAAQALGAGATQSDSFQVVASDGSLTSAPSTVGITITGSNDGAVITGATMGVVGEDGNGIATGTLSVADVDSGENHVQAGSVQTDEGTFAIGENGQWTFQVNSANADVQALGVGESMTKTFAVASADGTATQNVTVTITGGNDGPVVSGGVDLGDTAEDNSITFTKAQLLANASDVDGDSLSVSNLSSNHGSIVDNGDGTYTFTPTENYSGSVDVSYTVSDGHGGTVAGSASLDVSAVADQASVSLSIGAGSVDPGGSFTVTNNDASASAGYHNTYGYYVMDDDGNPVSGGVIWKDVHDTNGQSVTIEGVDPDRVGFFLIPNGDQNSSIRDGSPVTFSQDAAGNWQASDSSGHVLTGTGAKVLFDNKDLNSDDRTHLQDRSNVTGNQNWEDLNGGGDNDFNDVNMNVSWNAAEPTSTHEINVAASFPDMDGSEGHTVVLSGLPAGATLSQDGVALTPGADGSYTLNASDLDGLTLTTAPGFTGEIELSVTATSVDGTSTASASAQAEVTLDLGNEGPEAGDAESVTTAMRTSVSGQVEATDADGNELSFTLATGSDGAQHGTVALNPDGTFTYTPTGNYSGTDTFKVVVSDGHGGTTTETVTVTVENGAPTLTTSNAATADDHSAVTGHVSATDPNAGDTVSYHLVDANGNRVDSLSTEHGTVTIDSATGDYTFTPSGSSALGVGASATDSFKVVATDNHGDSSNVGTVNVTITGSNDGPVVTASDLVTGDDHTAVSGRAAGTDADAGDTVSYHLVDASGNQVDSLSTEHGTVTINTSTGEYTFTPSGESALGVGQTASDSFKVVAVDSHGAASPADTVNVTITGSNDGPVVDVVSGGSGTEDNAVTGSVAAHDVDGGDTLSYSLVDGNGNQVGSLSTEHGTVSINGATGEYTFTPNADWAGTDSFSVQVSDGHGGTVTQAVNVSVGAVADAPELSLQLGTGSMATLPGASEDVTITSANMNSSGGGFSVSAFNLDGSAGTLSTNQYGFGVSGGASGASAELGQSGGRSESISVNFEGDVSSADVSFGWLAPNEKAHYELYQDGVKVGEGTVTGITDRVDPSVSVAPTDGGSFDQIVFTAPGGGDNDYMINSISFEVAEAGERVVDYPLDVSASLGDTDGSERLAVSLSGLPEGAVIMDADGNVVGTDAGNGTWSLPAGDLDGLTLRVPAESEAFTLGATATSTESDPNAAVATASTSLSVAVGPFNNGPVAGDDSRIDDVAQGPALSVDVGDTQDIAHTTTTTTTVSTGNDVTWDGLDAMSDPTTATPTTTVSGDLNSANNGSGNADAISVGRDNNASISTGNGDDQVSIGRSVNARIDLGNGANALDVGDDVNASVSGGSGNDTVRVGDDLNGRTDLGNGDNRLQVGGDANASISSGSGDDDVKIGGDLNSNISLGSGNDDLQIGGDANASIDVGEGNDRVLVGDDLSSKASLGSGDDYMEVRDDSWASIDAGSGNDTIKIGGDISAKVDMGAGNDRVTISGDNLWATVTGGSGTDSIELTGVTKAEWDANANGVRNYVKDFENIKFADGQVIGDASAFESTTTVETTTTTHTYETPITVQATLNDTDGSETLSSVTLGSIPEGATLKIDGETLTANADGTYTIQVTSGEPVTVTMITDTQPSAGSLGAITTTVSSTEAHGGDVAVTTQVGIGSNAGETVADDRIATGTDRSVSISSADLLANDTDADGDSLSIVSVGNAQHGSVSIDNNGQIVFTADKGFEGTTTFEYTVSDGHGGTDTATVSVYVDDPNDAPVIDAAHTTATLNVDYSHANTSNIGQVTATDVNGDNLTYSVLDGGNHHGSLVIDSDSGSFFYNADDTGWSGTDTFTVQVSDGEGGLATQTISVQVTGGSHGGGGSGGGQPIGWGNGGGRDESWGANGSWSVGGSHSGGGHGNNGWGNGDQDAPGSSGGHNNAENDRSGGGRGHSGGGHSGGGHGHGGWGHNSGGGHDGDVTYATDDGTNWSSGWRAVDVGNGDQDGTNDTFSISGYNRHNETYNGDSGDTLIGAGGNDYMSLEGADGKQHISGYDHIQLGDGANAVLDMTTTRFDYGDLTVAGGTGHDVIWSASGDDLLVAGNGGNTIHGGAGDDTIVAGAGSDDLMGQDGGDTFLFDFGTGHDTVNGGAGGNWTDTIDLSTNMGEGATITISTGGHDWTVASDGDHQADGVINLGQDKSGTITVHSQDGDQTIEFTNIESIKF